MILIKERTRPARPATRPVQPAARSSRPASPPGARARLRAGRPIAPRPQPASPSRPAGPSPEPARLHGAALALILTAAFMVVLDFSIVNVALPSMDAVLGSSSYAVQWIITGYAIAYEGQRSLGARDADLYGARRMLMAGLLVYSRHQLA